MLLIMDIPTEVDNDAVMTFLQEYCSEAIGRTQIGSNYMVLALVLIRDANNQVNQSICLITDPYVVRDTMHTP
jgi:hypothetical protein